MHTMLRVAAHPLSSLVGDLEANAARALEAIAGAVEAGAKLIVLPELVTSGYVFESEEEARSLSIDTSHPLIEAWRSAAAAGGAVVVAGFCERTERALFNSAVVLDGGGVIAVYRKTHLWDREKLVFAAGDSRPPVIETEAGRVGVLVCYDLEFPEMPRALALDGADIIAVPTNWPVVPVPDGERPPEVIAAMAAARANRVFVVCCDRTGEERGVSFTGGSAIVDPDGWVVASRRDNGPLVADIDVTRARRKAIGPRNDVFGDRRPSLYGEGQGA